MAEVVAVKNGIRQPAPTPVAIGKQSKQGKHGEESASFPGCEVVV